MTEFISNYDGIDIKAAVGKKTDWSIATSLKEKWLKMLRGGRYKQTDSNLYSKHNNGYCCLGLLCKANGLKETEIAERQLPEELDMHLFGDAGDWEVPVRIYEEGDVRVDKIPLYELNDEYRLTFKQIADIVDATVRTHKG